MFPVRLVCIYINDKPSIGDIHNDHVSADYISYVRLEEAARTLFTDIQNNKKYKVYIPWQYISKRGEHSSNAETDTDRFIEALIIDSHIDHIYCYYNANDQTIDEFPAKQIHFPKIKELFHEDFLSIKLNIDVFGEVISQIGRYRANREIHLANHILSLVDRIHDGLDSTYQEFRSCINDCLEQHSNKFGQEAS